MILFDNMVYSVTKMLRLTFFPVLPEVFFFFCLLQEVTAVLKNANKVMNTIM